MSDLAAAGRMAATGTAFRVLVVDDDPEMAGFLSWLLTKEGMAADTVHDGEAAIARVAVAPPDLVLLDVMLPGADGFAVCERLKSQPASAMIPVVLVTALEDHESRVRGIRAGADDFLSKPVRREELIARVNTLRRLHETRRELEVRRLGAEIQHKETLRKAFARYVSPQLAERIISELAEDGAPFRREPQRVSVVALFADLRGFTRLTETTSSAEVVGMLNEYFQAITDAAYRHEGTIFSMAGDSLLVGFNVPFLQTDAAQRACRTARDMVESLAPVLQRWTERGGPPTGVGIGIASGEAILGNVGSAHYMSHTIIGDAVNTAARLMQMARPGEALLARPVYEAAPDVFGAERVSSRGEIALRGKSEAIGVYSVRF
ncbi:MAG TPA: response regulator [Burkholderiales bacterium]|nr:response regulator [Burkholderiales bacterium]